MGITSNEEYPGQATGDEVPKEPGPRRGRFRGGNLHAQKLSVAVSVDTCGQQHAGLYDTSSFPHLHCQRVAGDKVVGALVKPAGAEVIDHVIEFFGHLADLRLRQVVDPKGGHQVVHPASGDSFQVTGGDDCAQGTLGAAAAL